MDIEQIIKLLSNSYTIITIIGAIAIFFYQRNKIRDERFKQYAQNLHREDNPTAQITSAILLRSYLRSKFGWLKNSYKRDTINLIVAILRHIPNGNLQKTLADSISYMSDADGQDFQHTNLHAASIKPESRINYEISGDAKFLESKISMRCADFYRSDITQCCIFNIDAEKAVFFDSLLCQTSFYNCILKDANFRNADVNKLKFTDCVLDGADFSGARCIDSAKVIIGKQTYKLINCLNKDGVYDGYQEEIRFIENGDKKHIFISKLGTMNTKQLDYYTHIIGLIKKRYGYIFEEINPEEYWDSNQITMIKDRMSNCAGMLVFAFSYMTIKDGQIGNKSLSIQNEHFPSPWLHIEATMANAIFNFPTMIFTEENISCNGIFDDKVTQNDDLMFKINFKGTLSDEDEQTLSHWSRAVDRYKSN